MAFNERIKYFDRIRAYMRQFYVYGLKSRGGYADKSGRTYDDEHRRIESWLGDYTRAAQDAGGKRVRISIDSRARRHNPLFAAWKAKSFTDKDITLHFLLLDVLDDPSVALSLKEILDGIDERLCAFADEMNFDESTVRKKLNEYKEIGLIATEGRGKSLRYRRTPSYDISPYADALDFFTEVAPCGLIGSYLLDRLPPHESKFSFKHHYITAAMDSEIVYTLLRAMRTQTKVKLTCFRRDGDAFTETVTPLQILCGVQNGRQYLMCARTAPAHIDSLRIDYITAAEPTGETDPDFDRLRTRLQVMRTHMFGTNTGDGRTLYEVGFTVRFSADEPYIYQRLLREKRCGSVERLDEGSARFTATVYDASELIPWIRTFICRIVQFHCEDKAWENRFNEDLAKMYALYENGGDAK